MDTSYSWLHPTADTSSGGWIRVSADSILRLTLVPESGYELRLTLSHADLSSDGWIRVTADFNLRLTRDLAAGYNLRLIPSWSWLWLAAGSSCGGWTRLAADLYFNISSKLLCKIHHFYGLFSTAWFQLPLIQALAAASRTLNKKLEKAWGSLKKLQDSSCHWF